MLQVAGYPKASGKTAIKTFYTFVNGVKKYLWKDKTHYSDGEWNNLCDEYNYSPFIYAYVIGKSTNSITIRVLFESGSSFSGVNFVLNDLPAGLDIETSTYDTSSPTTTHHYIPLSVGYDNSSNSVKVFGKKMYVSFYFDHLTDEVNNQRQDYMQTVGWYISDFTNPNSTPIQIFNNTLCPYTTTTTTQQMYYPTIRTVTTTHYSSVLSYCSMYKYGMIMGGYYVPYGSLYNTNNPFVVSTDISKHSSYAGYNIPGGIVYRGYGAYASDGIDICFYNDTPNGLVLTTHKKFDFKTTDPKDNVYTRFYIYKSDIYKVIGNYSSVVEQYKYESNTPISREFTNHLNDEGYGPSLTYNAGMNGSMPVICLYNSNDFGYWVATSGMPYNNNTLYNIDDTNINLRHYDGYTAGNILTYQLYDKTSHTHAYFMEHQNDFYYYSRFNVHSAAVTLLPTDSARIYRGGCMRTGYNTTFVYDAANAIYITLDKGVSFIKDSSYTPYSID